MNICIYVRTEDVILVLILPKDLLNTYIHTYSSFYEVEKSVE